MAIFVTAAGGISRASEAGITLTIGAQQQQVGWPATNNRKSAGKGTAAKSTTVKFGKPIYGGNSSSAFQQLDQQIRMLDASFDLLVNQNEWDDYAAAIDGLWILCANCQPDSTGKKLFRQYNTNRLLIGLPIVDTPVLIGEYGGSGLMEFQAGIDPVTMVATVGVEWEPALNSNWITSIIGRSLLNPVLYLDPPDNGQVYESGSYFDFAVQLATFYGWWPPPAGDNNFSYGACTWTGNGAPGNGCSITEQVSG